MKKTQKDTNPFPYSDTNKRYYTYDYYLKKVFGSKCVKLPIDIGLTCPNIDGRCGVGGCIYCSPRGSGEFAGPAGMLVREQMDLASERLSSKWSTKKYIAYFQAHTNTYGPLDLLKEKFTQALDYPGVVGINIATRADCLEDETVEYLARLAEKTVLTVELGLQTSNDETAMRINRGHTFAGFVEGYEKLRKSSDKINICVHTILGLPGEDKSVMLHTAGDVAELHPDQLKLHLLHVLKNTKLADMYMSGKYIPLEREEYIKLVAETLELIPSDVVIARLTGDGAFDELIAPEWSRKKTTIINDIDKLLFSRNSMQGIRYSES